MFRKVVIMAVLCFVMTAVCGSLAFALGSGGTRNEVVDGEALGKANCVAAQADTPSAVHFNPAGLTQLDNASYVATGYTMEAPRSECETQTGDGTVQMQPQVFWIPYFYYVSEVVCEKFRLGFGATSPHGLATDWADDSFSANVMTESDLEFVNFNPTIAYKVNDVLSIGGGIDYLVSHLSKHRRIFGAGNGNGDFQLKGSDEGWGYNLGLLFKPSDKERIGVSYRSEIDLRYAGTVTLDSLAGLTQVLLGGVSTYTTAMTSDGTIPRSLAVGYAYQPDDRLTVEVDVEWTDWSCVESDFVHYPDVPAGNNALLVLNVGNPTSRDWRDAFSYGIGAEYKATDNLELRFGGMYQETPVPSHSFDTPLPDANKHGVTMGLGYKFKVFKEEVKMDFSYLFLKYRDRQITNDMGQATSATINADGNYKTYANVVAIGFTYKY